MILKITRAFFLPETETRSNTHIRPAGPYLCAYSKGSWDNLPRKYCEILQYAAKHNIQLKDYSYETSLNEIISESMDDYITQIEIPIKANTLDSPKIIQTCYETAPFHISKTEKKQFGFIK